MLRVNEESGGQTKPTSDWRSSIGSNPNVASNASHSAVDSSCRGLTGQKAEVYFLGYLRIANVIFLILYSVYWLF